MSIQRNRLLAKDEESQPGSEVWSLIGSGDFSDDDSVVVKHIDEKLAEDLDRV